MGIILRNRRILLVLLGLLSLVMGYGLKNIRIDFSFDSFNPPDEEEFLIYKAHAELFGYSDNTVQIAFGNPGKTVFDTGFLQKADEVLAQIGKIERVDSVIRPGNLTYLERRPGTLVPEPQPLFNLEDPTTLAESARRLRADSLLGSALISTDSSYFSGFALIDPTILDSAVRDTISNRIESILEDSGMEYKVSGIPLIRTQYVRRITSELFLFLALSLVLIIGILFLTYRSLWGIIFPLIAVFLALIWCLGFMGLMGTPLDLMSELLPPIMFVVGMSDIIHLVTKYIGELKLGKDREPAMQATLKEIGLATLLTSITTAIGFGSLLVSQMPPLKTFGFYAASGVIFAYLISIILIPNVLMRIPRERLIRSRGVGNLPQIEAWLTRMHHLVKRRAFSIIAGFIIVIGISLWGVTLISFNTFLLDDISPRDPIRESLTFFEENFHGLRPFELGIKTKEGVEVTDLALLQDMEEIQQFLRSETNMSPFLSPVTFLKSANQINRYGSATQFRLPRKQEKVEDYISGAIAMGGPGVLRPIMSEDRKYARMSARMSDVGTDSFNIIRQKLAGFIAENCDTTQFNYRLTGSAILNETNVKHLRSSLFSGLLLAFGLIGLIMALLFRSWKMLVIGIVVNIIPLLFTAGVMGFAGITLKASTSIIFLIAFGIAVDDTIHFLSRFKLEMNEGRNVEEALFATILGTGKAIILTSLILLFGFVLLLTSDFGGTFSIGLFTAMTLFTALFSDILLLPILIRWLGVGKKQEENARMGG